MTRTLDKGRAMIERDPSLITNCSAAEGIAALMAEKAAAPAVNPKARKPKATFRRKRVRSGVDTESRPRSMEHLRRQGYRCEAVEFKRLHLVPSKEHDGLFKCMGSHSNDLFGFMDLLAYRAGSPVLAVQACRRAEIKAHLDKFRADADVLASIRAWLGAGCAFSIHGWEAADRPTKNGKGTIRRWEVFERRVTIEDLTEELPF
jgi:hypothetical protein